MHWWLPEEEWALREKTKFPELSYEDAVKRFWERIGAKETPKTKANNVWHIGVYQGIHTALRNEDGQGRQETI